MNFNIKHEIKQVCSPFCSKILKHYLAEALPIHISLSILTGLYC